ncbi:MAG: LURP-one-related/scramblase family protein [Turicibacter sanguinis]
MGTYYIKQKIFSLRDHYYVYDKHEQAAFEVTGKFLAIADQLTIRDLNQNELFTVKQKLMTVWGAYDIYKGDILCATIKRRPSLFKPKLDVESEYGNFQLRGDVFDHNFSITKDGQEVGHIEKKWFKLSDHYELQVATGQDDAFFIAMLIAIDNCLHNNKNT